MTAKGVKIADLARVTGKSHATVERWLANAGRVPHPRTRDEVSRYLGVSEAVLWPSKTSVIKTGSDREILSTYPYRSACPTGVWAQLIGGAKKDVLLAGYTNYFLFTQLTAFPRTLRDLSDRGVRVRFLMGDPEGAVTRQREEIEDTAFTVSARIRITLEQLAKIGALEGLEARFSAPEDAMNHVSLSVFRMDNDALVTPHLARLVGHDSPMMHLRRRGEGGMFDRFAEHAEELWERGRPVA
jgi:transcriptional regulator with XRE-family HTH domain